jgi:hypothetical protein
LEFDQLSELATQLKSFCTGPKTQDGSEFQARAGIQSLATPSPGHAFLLPHPAHPELVLPTPTPLHELDAQDVDPVLQAYLECAFDAFLSSFLFFFFLFLMLTSFFGPLSAAVLQIRMLRISTKAAMDCASFTTSDRLSPPHYLRKPAGKCGYISPNSGNTLPTQLMTRSLLHLQKKKKPRYEMGRSHLSGSNHQQALLSLAKLYFSFEAYPTAMDVSEFDFHFFLPVLMDLPCQPLLSGLRGGNAAGPIGGRSDDY